LNFFNFKQSTELPPASKLPPAAINPSHEAQNVKSSTSLEVPAHPKDSTKESEEVKKMDEEIKQTDDDASTLDDAEEVQNQVSPSTAGKVN
jgi:hypothetical protein